MAEKHDEKTGVKEASPIDTQDRQVLSSGEDLGEADLGEAFNPESI